MRELIEKKQKSGADIRMISHDSYGGFSFLIGGVEYRGEADAAIVNMAVKKAKRSPGAALNMLKKVTELKKVSRS